MKQRSATANQLRGLLAEYGVVTQSSSVCLIGAIPCILEDANNELSDLSRTFVLRMSEHYKRLSQEIDEVTQQLVHCASMKTMNDYRAFPASAPLWRRVLLVQ